MRIKDIHKVNLVREKAVEMIVKEGFQGLSMQKLAHAANVSPATLYIYFESREDMLNQLFNHVHKTFAEIALKGFDAGMNFKEGLWLQWKNRLQFVNEYPMFFAFHEQFRSSPLVNHCDVKNDEFKDSMEAFMRNASKRGEIINLEPEIFWSIAHAPFYALIRFSLQNKTMMNNKFILNEKKLRQVFELLIKTLEPETSLVSQTYNS